MNRQYSFNCGGRLLDLSEPKIMGILNITPDSFYDGGQYLGAAAAIQQAQQMLAEGADIIDVGGMSSRPGAPIVDPTVECERVVPVIRELRRSAPECLISIDTVHGYTAERAIDAGADIINDISGGSIDPSICQIAAARGTPYILMHMQGRPSTMQVKPEYGDVMLEVSIYLRDKVVALRQQGIKDIAIDPGFGFGKTAADNYTLLRQLESLHWIGAPILVGLSRKSMIYQALDITAEQSLNGTTALHMAALLQGVQLLRVHDVWAAKQALQLYTKMMH